MKFLAIFSVALIIACVQAQNLPERSETLPVHLVGGTKAALQNSPAVTTPLKVQQAIQHPFENVADAVSHFDPRNAPLYQRYAGFDIPINRDVFSSLLQTAYNHRRFDRLTIVSIVAASVQIPNSGDLKKIGLFLVKEFLCRIANSGLLPGIQNNIPFILKTVNDNNRLKNGITKSVVNGAGEIPFIGKYIKHFGKTVAGVPGLGEVIRVYADNPARALKALTTYVHRQGPIGSTCPAPSRTPVAQPQTQPGPPFLPIVDPQRPIGPAPDVPAIGATPF